MFGGVSGILMSAAVGVIGYFGWIRRKMGA
jgi:hypothetical protein